MELAVVNISVKILLKMTLAVSVLTFASCTPSRTAELNLPELQVVEKVDLQKYAGTWYEVARLPNGFQKDCVATRAIYSVLDDERVKVVNECRKGALDGKLKTIEGSAKVVDKETGAKLAVTFFWPFSGDYWIVDLAEDYSYAAVATPERNYLWILSRTAQMDPAEYQGVVARLQEDGFAVEQLIETSQPSSGSSNL